MINMNRKGSIPAESSSADCCWWGAAVIPEGAEAERAAMILGA